MTVRCPRCGTLYRRPTRPAIGPGTTFRCTRCRHVFATDEEPAEEPPETDADTLADDDEDQFTFDDEPDDRSLRAHGRDEDEDDDAPDDDDEPEAAAPAARRMSTPAHFAVRALLCVTLGYAGLSIYLWTHPAATRELFRNVPVIGPRLAESRLDPASIQLTGVRGEYRRVQGDHLVFVISGVAVNNSPVPVKGVQVQGRLVGAGEQRQVVFCGAAPRVVQDLSLREIALLQTLEPPKDWTLAPGEQANFLVAFAGPPDDLKEFTVEVVAVQAPARRG
jgi:hypothetical protein